MSNNGNTAHSNSSQAPSGTIPSPSTPAANDQKNGSGNHNWIGNVRGRGVNDNGNTTQFESSQASSSRSTSSSDPAVNDRKNGSGNHNWIDDIRAQGKSASVFGYNPFTIDMKLRDRCMMLFVSCKLLSRILAGFTEEDVLKSSWHWQSIVRLKTHPVSRLLQ